jgi:hypothetical protein
VWKRNRQFALEAVHSCCNKSRLLALCTICSCERQNRGPSKDSGLSMMNLESQSRDPPPESGRRIRLLWFYLFVLHSIPWQKTCHYTAILRHYVNLSVFLCILRITSSRFGFSLLNIYHFMHIFTFTYRGKHTQAHDTCIISKQDEWRQLGTATWLKGAREILLWETMGLHTHK